jgi:hypothetical protein
MGWEWPSVSSRTEEKHEIFRQDCIPWAQISTKTLRDRELLSCQWPAILSCQVRAGSPREDCKYVEYISGCRSFDTLSTSGHYIACLTFNNSAFCSHSVFICLFGFENTAIISLHSINWVVFITKIQSVYCAVRTGSLNAIQQTLTHETERERCKKIRKIARSSSCLRPSLKVREHRLGLPEEQGERDNLEIWGRTWQQHGDNFTGINLVTCTVHYTIRWRLDIRETSGFPTSDITLFNSIHSTFHDRFREIVMKTLGWRCDFPYYLARISQILGSAKWGGLLLCLMEWGSASVIYCVVCLPKFLYFINNNISFI